MLRLPPDGNGYLTYLVNVLNAELMRREPTVVGLVYDPFDSTPDDLEVGLLTAATAHMGDATNYAAFAADGELSLHGTARVVKDIEIPLSGFGKGAAAPATVYLGNLIGFEFTTNDVVYYAQEMPYDWDSATALSFEMRWYVDEAFSTAPSGEVRWQLSYVALKENGTEAADTAATAVDSGDINIPTDAKCITETKFAIPAAALQADDLLFVSIKRIAIAGGNAPTAKPVMVGAALEYTANKLGEAT